MIVREIVAVIALSITSTVVILRILLEVLAHAVEDDHRLVDRVTEHREHRRQHRQRKLPAEDREHADHQDHVVQIGDDRGDRELPLEAEGEVDHDADDDQQQCERAVVREFLADRRADELHALELDRRVLGLQRLHHALGLLARMCRLSRSAAGSARRARCRSSAPGIRLQPCLLDRAANLLEIRGLRIADLHHRAAGELDRQVQAARRPGRRPAMPNEMKRDRVEDQRVAHEGNRALDAEEFHGRVPERPTSRQRPQCPAARSGRPKARQLLARAVDQVDDRARHEHCREDRRQNAQAVHDRKPAHRSGAEDQQRHAGDQRRDVRVEDRREGLVVAFVDRLLRTAAVAQFLAHALVDQHVGVDRHAERQRDGRDARQRQRGLQQRQQRDQQHHVDAQRDHRDQAEHPVVQDHEDRDCA